MLDPVQFVEVFKTKTATLPGGKIPLPTSTSVSPIPTVIPTLPTYEKIHHAGATTLWVAFAIFLASTIVLAFIAWRTPVQKRLFGILTTFITAISTIAYYAQATGAGSTFIHIVLRESNKNIDVPTTEHLFRQVFWAHAVDSALTFPLVLLTLSFLSGISGANILVILFADLALVLTGLFASFGAGASTKWGWFVLALISFLVIAYQLVIPGRRAIKAKGDAATGQLYAAIGGYTVVLWLLYLVVWAVAEGTRKWSVDAEVIAYAVLDVLAKPVFAFWLIFAHSKKTLSLDGFWSHGLATEGAVRLEDEEA